MNLNLNNLRDSRGVRRSMLSTHQKKIARKGLDHDLCKGLDHELEQYLADPEEPDTEVDVLAWWKAKETKWPALAKMVKQYFAAPASSAGVERIFSAAGKMHSDLQKSAKDTTLEHSLFAAFNTD